MKFSVAFLALLGGYLFCDTWEYTKYRYHRRSGYRFFFISAVSGVLLLVSAYVFLHLLSSVWDWPFRVWNQIGPNLPYLGTCLVAFLVAWPVAALFNKGSVAIGKNNTIEHEIDKNGDGLEKLLSEAIGSMETRDSKLVMLTLSNDKVFIGTVSADPDPYGDRSYVRILKIASGYRTGDEKKVRITTRYGAVLLLIGAFKDREVQASHEDLLPEVQQIVKRIQGKDLEALSQTSASDFDVLVPKSEIISITYFNPDLSKYLPDSPRIFVEKGSSFNKKAVAS